MDRMSDNRTILSGYQTLSEIRTVLEPDRSEKCRNPDVRILDVYCIRIFSLNLTVQVFFQKESLSLLTRVYTINQFPVQCESEIQKNPVLGSCYSVQG